MKKYRWPIIIIALGAVAILAMGMYFLGDKHGVESMTFKTATPTELADAMKNDNFYSIYRENTLIVSGVIASLSQQGNDLVLGFKTSSSYNAYCNLGSATTSLHVGDTTTVMSEAARAERQPGAVMLTGCMIR